MSYGITDLTGVICLSSLQQESNTYNLSFLIIAVCSLATPFCYDQTDFHIQSTDCFTAQMVIHNHWNSCLKVTKNLF